jgi:hypothetical protein
MVRWGGPVPPPGGEGEPTHPHDSASLPSQGRTGIDQAQHRRLHSDKA